MLAYHYAHTETSGTTGYFSCIPDQEPDLEFSLSKLAKRPLDTFMHRHALRHVLALPPEKLCRLAVEILQGTVEEQGIAAAMLLEAALLRQDDFSFTKETRQALRRYAMPFSRHTPLPMLDSAENCASAKNRQWSNIFRDNLAAHKPLGHTARDHALPKADIVFPSASIAREILEQERASIMHDNISRMECATPKKICERALGVLERAGLLDGPEMRHEASLSPIALLRNWHVSVVVAHGGNAHTLTGKATAYGRGLSLAGARASCLMEIVERACAYAGVEEGGAYGCGKISGRLHPLDLLRSSYSGLRRRSIPAVDPSLLGSPVDMTDVPLHWVAGRDSHGKEIYIPAQAVFLFFNLDEPAIFESGGSTGLASGSTPAQARLNGLTEVLERYAHASTPYDPRQCFLPRSRDPLLSDLLADYHARGIYPQFQDITTELGLPAYRCFVAGKDGLIAQATGCALKGRHAALSALTETPWPYSWATPAPFGKPSALPPRMPVRVLEDLPDYDMPSPEEKLLLLESILRIRGLTPVYVDISREDLGFPVFRVTVPGLEINADFDETYPPGNTLLARSQLAGLL